MLSEERGAVQTIDGTQTLFAVSLRPTLISRGRLKGALLNCLGAKRNCLGFLGQVRLFLNQSNVLRFVASLKEVWRLQRLDLPQPSVQFRFMI